MKKTAYLVLFATILTLASVGAYAQYELDYDTSQPAWNIHAGAAWMLGDSQDDVEVIVGLGYETPFSEDNPQSLLGFSVDYVPVSSGDDTVALVPALIYFKRTTAYSSYRLWGAIGIGARWADDDIPEMRIDDGFDFAWTLQAGVDITPEWFAQLRYIAGDNAGDDGFLTTELGYRF